jgi:hypothetical protein
MIGPPLSDLHVDFRELSDKSFLCLFIYCYSGKKVEETQERFNLNGMRLLLLCACDVNLLGITQIP